nr:hypothetical protein [uncultured Rhodopila sp.]
MTIRFTKPIGTRMIKTSEHKRPAAISAPASSGPAAEPNRH